MTPSTPEQNVATSIKPNAPVPTWWEELEHTMPEVLRGLRVGIYGSGGAPFHHAALVALWGGKPLPVRAEDIREGVLEHLDVLIFPGGGMTAMTGMLTPLGVDGARAVREWVAGGGMYLGSCAGSFLPAAVGEGYWQAHEEARQLHMVSATLANGSDSAFEGLTSPGVGTLEVAVVNHDHWLTAGLPERFELVHYNGPLFALDAHELASDAAFTPAQGILRPVAAGMAFTPSEGFLARDFGKVQDTLLERCLARGAYNGVTARYGDGQVVLFGSHPEFGFDVLQLGWGPGVRLLANALRHQAERRQSANHAPLNTTEADTEEDNRKLRTALVEASDALERIAVGFRELSSADTGDWLEPTNAPAFLGRSPAQLWREATGTAAWVADEGAALARRLLTGSTDLRAAARWIDESPLPNQDVGFMGLRQLVAHVEKSVAVARRQLDEDATPPAHAYDGMDTHPYQIAASSYLSAAGLTAAAFLSLTVIVMAVGHGELVPLEMLVQPVASTEPLKTTST
ncbi:hypothetical protein BH24DEI2_BH24DEI2_12690 [soil metagenome]